MIEEVQDRLSRAIELLVFNDVQTSINTKDELLVTINSILNDLTLNLVVNNTRKIGIPGVKPCPILSHLQM